MAQLIVRDLEEGLVLALKRRAAEHGRSAEAEHREILRQTLQTPRPAKTIKDFLLQIPNVGKDGDFRRRRDRGRQARL
jgi:antitoxin FitA